MEYIDTNKRQVKDTRGPVNILHNDYTEKSGPQRITDLLDSEKAKRVLSGRFALVNVWRSIGPNIQRLPLAVADAKTSLVITGNGDVIEPENSLIAIGSGGAFAQSAARALLDNTDLSAEDIVNPKEKNIIIVT